LAAPVNENARSLIQFAIDFEQTRPEKSGALGVLQQREGKTPRSWAGTGPEPGFESLPATRKPGN
jgi:hypothetical protein